MNATRKSSTSGSYCSRTSGSRTRPPTKLDTFHLLKKEPTSQKSRKLLAGRRRVSRSLNGRRTRILPTFHPDQRITPSLRRTENRAENSRKLSAKIPNPEKSSKRHQGRLSSSSGVPRHFDS